MKKICILLASCLSAGYILSMETTKSFKDVIKAEAYTIAGVKRKMVFENDWDPVNWAHLISRKVGKVHFIRAFINHQNDNALDCCELCKAYEQATQRHLTYLSNLCDRLITTTSEYVFNVLLDVYSYECAPHLQDKELLFTKMHDAIDRYNALVEVSKDKRLLQIHAHIEIIRDILNNTKVKDGGLDAEIRASLQDL